MCEVAAGAGGCVAVDVQRLAAVGGPAALQAVRLVLPEGALGHVSLRVDWLWGEKQKNTVFRSSPRATLWDALSRDSKHKWFRIQFRNHIFQLPISAFLSVHFKLQESV